MPEITPAVDRPAAAPQSGDRPPRQYEPALEPPARHDGRGGPVGPNYVPRFGDNPPANALTDVERGYLDRSVAFPSGRAYFPAHEPDKIESAAKIETYPGWYLIAAHGGPDHIGMPREDGTLERLSAQQFKRILDNDPTWNGRRSLFFAACETGQQFTQELYELYDGQVTICGPEHLLHIGDGNVTHSRLERDPRTGKPRIDGYGDFIYTPVEPSWHINHRRLEALGGPADA